jgi:hypothetical protein
VLLPDVGEGMANGEYIRRRLKTGSWERAAELARVIEDSEESGTTPKRKEEPVTVEQAVSEYLADAKARELSEATLYKLDIFFRKQFLSWCKSEGYRLLRELDLPAVRSFRSSGKDGAMAKKKKQERLTGFFWFCIRASWITTNPTHNLGRISVTQAPTDYFTRDQGHIRFTPTRNTRPMENAAIRFPEAAGKAIAEVSILDDPLYGREGLLRFTDGTQLSICVGVSQTVDARYCREDAPATLPCSEGMNGGGGGRS